MFTRQVSVDELRSKLEGKRIVHVFGGGDTINWQGEKTQIPQGSIALTVEGPGTSVQLITFSTQPAEITIGLNH
jgi:hypothetical protein